MRLIPIALLCVVLASPASPDTLAFEGAWDVTDVLKAPWEDPGRPVMADNAKRYMGRTLTIESDSVRGLELMDCGETELFVQSMPFAGLFEGGLATDPQHPDRDYDEPRARSLARELGFAAEPVPTLSQGCSEVTLHLRDPRTLMFGLDNRIFVLTKR